jgi:hypothetical protein
MATLFEGVILCVMDVAPPGLGDLFAAYPGLAALRPGLTVAGPPGLRD